MPSGPHRPRFYLGVLVIGFIVGGFLTAFFRRWLPESAAREFLTTSATPVFGPVGPVGLHVSLLSLIGVLVAYLIARSLF